VCRISYKMGNEIIHYIKKHNNRLVYICNWACGITKGKFTAMKGKVTCKNCKRILYKEVNNNGKTTKKKKTK